MNREDLKDIIKRIINEIKTDAETACIWADCDDCSDCVDCKDVIMYYGIVPTE